MKIDAKTASTVSKGYESVIIEGHEFYATGKVGSNAAGCKFYELATEDNGDRYWITEAGTITEA